jgi:hypothetical protein
VVTGADGAPVPRLLREGARAPLPASRTFDEDTF